MNEPLEKALVTLRADLTLQVAAGDISLDVELGEDGAYGLAQALLANLERTVPWFGREDAYEIGQVHSVAFAALWFIHVALRGQPFNNEDRLKLRRACDQALVALVVYPEGITSAEIFGARTVADIFRPKGKSDEH